MSGYYEWQKQQANEQIQARLREAESHRLASQVDGRSPLPTIIKLAVPILIGVAISIFLITY